MRTVPNEAASASKSIVTTVLNTFSATLSDGREITVREMTGRDLIYLEEDLAKKGETRKTFHLLERLNVGDVKVTFDEIADLSIKDIKKISELVGKANGDDEDDENEGEDSPK